MSAPVDTEALVVRSVDYGESDRIVTLLTRRAGKVGAIARGAKRSRRRFAGALQPFQLIRVSLSERRGAELMLLTEAEVVRHYPTIETDAARYAHAALAVELVRELTPAGEPDERPLGLLEGYLAALDAEGPHVRLLAELVLAALSQGGFAVSLSRCASCGKEAPKTAAAMFDVRRGIVCTSCGGAPLKMRGRVRAALLAASAGEDLQGTSDDDLAEGIDLLLAFARDHLGKELRAEALLRGPRGRGRRRRSDPDERSR